MQRAIVAALFALTVWAYWPTLSAGFVYEDAVYVDRAVSPTDRVLPFSPRALTEWTFRANYLATRSKPWSYHAVNLALHLLNGWLLWLVARRWMRGWAAVAVAGLFWLTPMASQAVSYVAGRADLIAATGVLCALLVATSGPFSGRVAVGLALSLGIACGGKEFGLMGALVVGLYWWHLRRPWSPTTRMIVIAAVVAVVVIAPLLYLKLMAGNDYVTLSERRGMGYMAVQAAAFCRFLGLTFWPVGLTVDHDFDVIGPSIAFPALIGLILLCGIAWRWSSQRSLVGFGLLSSVIVLLPRFFVRIPEYLNEHQFYLSLIGIALAVGGVVQLLEDRLERHYADVA